MFINSVFGFLVPVAAREGGVMWLIIVRFIQGLGEGPIVPCTHAMLAKWIPPNERSRMGAFVYAGAQFGTIVSMPLSGLLAEYVNWDSIFYVFGESTFSELSKNIKDNFFFLNFQVPLEPFGH